VHERGAFILSIESLTPDMLYVTTGAQASLPAMNAQRSNLPTLDLGIWTPALPETINPIKPYFSHPQGQSNK
jgi:hypothetical protein